MHEINYIGEHLVYGRLGNFFLLLSFVAALYSSVCYFLSIKARSDEVNSWIRLSRIGLFIHAASLVGVISIIFFLIHGHYFEYYYVWQHSSSVLPLKYIWACFWEGQEGSFLLWSFWHMVLAFFLLGRSGSWEAPALTVLMMIQAFLGTMVLGLELGESKIGTNPFILLREHPDFAQLPFIQSPDYLSKITDGRGLNPLLQNYWMVIHPPTLFLGFAATAIPFCFALGALVSGRVRDWVQVALPWTYFGIMILGTGILMGGAWAYEALSFGGFWAWDPVENASLVPWLTLGGAGHIMLIYQRKKEGLGTVYLLTIISFVLILYSTFLTRSGILGDTSVHAFTDLGMTGQLIIYMAFFTILSGVLVFVNRKRIFIKQEDEKANSREFWMFIGMLVLLISAIQISITTSIPVINKIFGTDMAPPADAISFYNSWQVPLAILLCLLIALAQFFKWKGSPARQVLLKLMPSFILALILTAAIELYFSFSRIQYQFLLFASLWAVIANVDYLIRVLKGKVRLSGPSTAHAGIGLILLGALIANAEQEVISRNMLNVDLGKDFPNNENILLYQGDTLPMGEYYVTYKGKQQSGVNLLYEIEYYKANHDKGMMSKAFSLFPRVQLNERMGNVSEPSTRHFIDRDIYTHITYAEMDEKKEGDDHGHQEENEYREPVRYKAKEGDTLITNSCMIVVGALNKAVDREKLFLSDSDLAVGIPLTLVDVNRKAYRTEPIFVIRGQNIYSKETLVEELGLKLGFTKILPDENKVEISISEKKSNQRDFVIMKAIIFPWINLLWAGCLLLFMGTFIAIWQRIRN